MLPWVCQIVWGKKMKGWHQLVDPYPFEPSFPYHTKILLEIAYYTIAGKTWLLQQWCSRGRKLQSLSQPKPDFLRHIYTSHTWEMNTHKYISLKNLKELKGVPKIIAIHTTYSIFDIHTAYQIHLLVSDFFSCAKYACTARKKHSSEL